MKNLSSNARTLPVLFACEGIKCAVFSRPSVCLAKFVTKVRLHFLAKKKLSLFATCKLGRDLYSGSTYSPVYTVLYMPLLVIWTAHPNCCHMPSELVHHVNHVLSCIQYVKSLFVTPKNECVHEGVKQVKLKLFY